MVKPHGFSSAPAPFRNSKKFRDFLAPLPVGMVILGMKRSHRRLFQGCGAAWGQWGAQTPSPHWEMKGRDCVAPLAVAAVPTGIPWRGILTHGPFSIPSASTAFPPRVPHWGSPAFMGTSFWGGGSEVRIIPFPWELEKPVHLQGDSVNKEEGRERGGLSICCSSFRPQPAVRCLTQQEAIKHLLPARGSLFPLLEGGILPRVQL